MVRFFCINKKSSDFLYIIKSRTDILCIKMGWQRPHQPCAQNVRYIYRKNRTGLLFKQKIVLTFCLNKKSARFFLYIKVKNYQTLFKILYKKSVRFFVYILKNRTDFLYKQKNSVDFLFIQKLGLIFLWIKSDFLYKHKIGPIFCIYKKSDRFCVYNSYCINKSRSDFLYIIKSRTYFLK